MCKCNICTRENNNIDNYVTIKCGHEFCKKCIFTYYMNIANSMFTISGRIVYEKTCPICFKDGGYLDESINFSSKKSPIYGVHIEEPITNYFYLVKSIK